jgi:hypothetical protein
VKPGRRKRTNKEPIDEETDELVRKIRQDPQRNWRLLPAEMPREAFTHDFPAGVLEAAWPFAISGTGDGDEAMTRAYAARYLADTLKRMKAADPVEEMLVTQMVWTHARLSRLTRISSQQSTKVLSAIAEACDSASNTYRRLMLALVEYRNPKRNAATITSVRQTNIAEQQVIQQQNATAAAEAAAQPEKENEKGSNKKGSAEPAAAAALLPDGSGAGFVAEFGTAGEAVAVDAGAADGRGQGQEQPQRP